MIRQAISCDICGSEKKQTNHWFVAYDQAGELRVSGWNSRNRLRPGSKHLCGQTCLHKLVDEFVATALAVRALPSTATVAAIGRQNADTDTSLTSQAAFIETESSAHLVAPLLPPVPKPALLRAPVELVTMPARPTLDARAADIPDDPEGFSSSSWRVEAWKREREREMRANGRRPVVAVRRRSN